MNAVEAIVSEIGHSPTNPRKGFTGAQLVDLAQSIRAQGIIQPLLLRPWKGKAGPKWELVCGARRLAAAKLAELTTVPAVVRELVDDEVLDIQLIENVQRADLTPLEESAAYAAQVKAGRSVLDVAKRISKDESYVYDRLALQALIPALRKHLDDGAISVSHAIILARLSAKDQERCLGNERASALFEREHLLVFDKEDKTPGRPVSVRELQAWVDEHVRFSFKDPHTAHLFPETVEAATAAAAKGDKKKTKVIAITYQHFVQPEARDDRERTISPRSWKRADGKEGSKKCESAALGVVAAGAHRGAAFDVCIDKKGCATHWGKEQKESARLAKAREKGGPARGKEEQAVEARYEREEAQRKKDNEQRDRFGKSGRALASAFAEALSKQPTTAGGALGELIVSSLEDMMQPDAKKLWGVVPRGRTTDSLVRHVAMAFIADALCSFNGQKSIEQLGKQLGVDVKAIIEKVAPAPVEKKEPAKAKEKSKAA